MSSKSATQNLFNALKASDAPLFADIAAKEQALAPVSVNHNVYVDGSQVFIDLNGVISTIAALVKEHCVNKKQVSCFVKAIKADAAFTEYKRAMYATRKRVISFDVESNTAKAKCVWLYKANEVINPDRIWGFYNIVKAALDADQEALGLNEDAKDAILLILCSYLISCADLIKFVLCPVESQERDTMEHSMHVEFKDVINGFEMLGINVETEEAGKEPAAPKALGFVPAMPTLPKLCSPAICEPVGTQFIPAGRLNSLLYRDNNGKIFADVREVVFAAIDLTGGMGAFLRCESDIRDYLNEINEHEAMIALRSCLYDYAIDGYNSKTLEKVRIVAASDAYQAFNKFFNGIKNTFELFAIKHGMSAAATQQAIKGLAALNETLEYAAKNSLNTVYFYSIFSNEFADWKVFTWSRTLYRKTLGFIPAMPTLPKMAHVEVEAAAPVETHAKAGPSTTTKGSNAALIMAKLNDAVANSSCISHSLAAKAKALPVAKPMSPFVFGVYDLSPSKIVVLEVSTYDLVDFLKQVAASNILACYSLGDLAPLFNALADLVDDAVENNFPYTVERVWVHSRDADVMDTIKTVKMCTISAAVKLAWRLEPYILGCFEHHAKALGFPWNDNHNKRLCTHLGNWIDNLFACQGPMIGCSLFDYEREDLLSFLGDSGRPKASSRDQHRASSVLRTLPRTYKTSLHDAIALCRKAGLDLGDRVSLLGASKEPLIYHMGVQGPMLNLKAFKAAFAKSLNALKSSSLASLMLNQLDIALEQHGVKVTYVSNTRHLTPLNDLLNSECKLARILYSCAAVGACHTTENDLSEIRGAKVHYIVNTFARAFDALITLLIYDNFFLAYSEDKFYTVEFKAHIFTSKEKKDKAA